MYLVGGRGRLKVVVYILSLTQKYLEISGKKGFVCYITL